MNSRIIRVVDAREEEDEREKEVDITLELKDNVMGKGRIPNKAWKYGGERIMMELWKMC